MAFKIIKKNFFIKIEVFGEIVIFSKIVEKTKENLLNLPDFRPIFENMTISPNTSILMKFFFWVILKAKYWDKIAIFIYKDLCGTPELRQVVLDVQFHLVKMLLFVKCGDEAGRDKLVAKSSQQRGWSGLSMGSG